MSNMSKNVMVLKYVNEWAKCKDCDGSQICVNLVCVPCKHFCRDVDWCR